METKPTRAGRSAEALLLSAACLAPWAFGSVEAWALLMIDACVALATGLRLVEDVRRRPSGFHASQLALLALAGLAFAQAAPLPGSPRAAGDGPAVGESRVVGDDGPPIPAPASTISRLPEASVTASARLASAGLLFVAAAGLGGGTATLRRFALLTTVNAAAMALFSLVQGMSWDGRIFGLRASPIGDGWRTGGPFVGHNPLAAYLNLGLGFSLGFLLGGAGEFGVRRRRLSFEPWAAYTTALIVAGLAGSHSRSGLIASAAASVAVTVLVGRGAIRTAASAFATLVIAATILLAAGDGSPGRRLVSVLEAGAFDDRREIWGAAARAWAHAPLLGSGFGAFATAVAPEFQEDRGVLFARAENEYLDVLVEGGALGLAVVLAGAASVFACGFRAFRTAESPRDRSLIAGCLFGLVALAVQSTADFSPHIPGVAVAAIVAGGLLVRLGAPATFTPGRAPTVALRLGTLAIAAAVLLHTSRLARSEAKLAGSALPPPGTGIPSGIVPGVARPRLDRMKEALERALAVRPNWAEGKLRLGLVHLGLYGRAALEQLGDEVEEESDRATLADPMWLHGVVHTSPAGPIEATREALAHDPVRDNLAPAARCFLEARSLCPSMAAAHANLATLDYLVEGEVVEDHVRRALATAGADFPVRMKASKAAAQAGLLDLAGEGWRTCIEVRETAWQAVVVEAALALGPEAVLNRVLPAGPRWPVLVADYLYAAPEDDAERLMYLRVALDRLDDDPKSTEAERRWAEGRACAGLGDDRRAKESWARALALEPANAPWRSQYVEWLASRGEPGEAYENAVVGLDHHPDDARLRAAALAAADAIARGPSSPIPAR